MLAFLYVLRALPDTNKGDDDDESGPIRRLGGRERLIQSCGPVYTIQTFCIVRRTMTFMLL